MQSLPDRQRLDLGGVDVLLLHDRGALTLDPRDGVLWFNPGSAGAALTRPAFSGYDRATAKQG